MELNNNKISINKSINYSLLDAHPIALDARMAIAWFQMFVFDFIFIFLHYLLMRRIYDYFRCVSVI